MDGQTNVLIDGRMEGRTVREGNGFLAERGNVSVVYIAYSTHDWEIERLAKRLATPMNLQVYDAQIPKSWSR